MRRGEGDTATFVISLAIGASLLTCLFLAFAWGSSLMKQANMDREMNIFQKENARMQKENDKLLDHFQYLQSSQYRDKWAKEHKGLLKQGERVIIVESRPNTLEDANTDEEIVKREILLSMPNREQWKIFFFQDKRSFLRN